MPYEIGDLVWAKMKGFCPWPGKISNPPSDIKLPKKLNNDYFIYFFGSKNYGVVKEDNIKPYFDHKLEMINKSKTCKFKEAVEDIEEYINNIESSHTSNKPVRSKGKQKKQIETDSTLEKALAVAAKEFYDVDFVTEVRTEPESEVINVDKYSVKEENCENKENSSTNGPSCVVDVEVEIVRDSFQCETCAQSFPDHSQLESHAQTHERSELNNSTREKKKSRSPRKFSTPKIKLNKKRIIKVKVRNIRKKDILGKDFVCKVCERIFSLPEHLEAHSKSHSKKKITQAQSA